MKNIRRLLMSAVFVFAVTPAFADLKQGLAAVDARDFPKAAKLLAEAFGKGEADAAFYMGRLLELGASGNPDVQGAIAMYVAGSSKGSALAKNRLGLLHLEGAGVLQDYEKGAKLICEAAAAGEPNAEFNCGSLLDQGKGLPKDPKKAIEWYQKAAAHEGLVANFRINCEVMRIADFSFFDLKELVRDFERDR